MTYDGYDTIKIYWRDTSWFEEDKNCIVFKKVTEYYTGSARVITMGNNSSYDSEDSDSPFADRKINVTKSIDSIVNSDELETADIHRTDW